MAGTYTQIHIHFVFAVRGRECLIHENFREQVEKYITGIVQNRNHKMLAIYCMPDHIHFFVGKRSHQSESDLVKEVKVASTKYIQENRWVKGHFTWQEGYGAFSHSKSHVQNVINYILNQPIHHQKRRFREEYISMLKRHEIEFDEKYLFEWVAVD